MTGNMFTEEEAAKEAARCLHCDCRKKDDCRLRKTAEKYNARPTAHRTGRRKFTQDRSHPEIIYEKGKCIACGICVRLCEGENNCPGLGNSGRGFAMRIDTPFGESIRDAIKSEALARKIVDSCPTGAFSFRD
jgi:NADH dehydrogenase/NADH:ubiquinone oxidoreductase subunit G